MRPDCARLFEVEAMRDGRLAGSERDSFVRHMSACRACAREAEALDRLVEEVRGRCVGDEAADELRAVRQRTRLLAAFDRALLTSGRRRPRRWLLGMAGAVAIAGGVLLAPRSRPTRPVADAPAAVIQPAAGTVWSAGTDGDVERIVLERGALTVHVDHATSRRGRVLVVLPDGELEDIGTTFTVSAADGHTQQVAVQQGSVLLRIRGAAPVALDAGQAWEARPPAAPPAGAPPARVQPAPAVKAPPPRAHAPRDLDEPPPSREFRALVRLLEGGEDCEAATRAARFVAAYPDDPRVEDAAYLRVVALQRCGSADDMKQAAREYLRRFPSAFRRAEVERLSR
ncbi:MAG TPA: hypothetical protein VN962_12795 [Polyangia bacterium]|nr:hypothetical protein [Polyangia bacterium]